MSQTLKMESQVTSSGQKLKRPVLSYAARRRLEQQDKEAAETARRLAKVKLEGNESSTDEDEEDPLLDYDLPDWYPCHPFSYPQYVITSSSSGSYEADKRAEILRQKICVTSLQRSAA